MSNFEEQYQKKHKRLSLIKSYIRMGACAIFFGGLLALGYLGDLQFWLKMSIGAVMPIGFFIAEMIGIAEENI